MTLEYYVVLVKSSDRTYVGSCTYQSLNDAIEGSSNYLVDSNWVKIVRQTVEVEMNYGK